MEEPRPRYTWRVDELKTSPIVGSDHNLDSRGIRPGELRVYKTDHPGREQEHYLAKYDALRDRYFLEFPNPDGGTVMRERAWFDSWFTLTDLKAPPDPLKRGV